MKKWSLGLKLIFFKNIFLAFQKYIMYWFALTENYFLLYTSVSSFYLLCLCLRLHTFLRCTSFYDICVVDWPLRNIRFELVYIFLSPEWNIRILVKVFTDNIPSLTSLFLSAYWIEREAWDMFGILFTQHSDLRRLLTDYGFEFFPLRKDFPLTGYFEIRYNDEIGLLSYELVELSQEYRLFNFSSPWEKNIVYIEKHDVY